ncbi:unnamed protein product [Cuscuta campestris]|uniref:Uncharacterized protein n=1 Tax=Cuscuta campestris TaxID=132261 RepID=A0A484M3X0_9ASTE|nr:unnamed protein product [Cuscuta campestris]
MAAIAPNLGVIGLLPRQDTGQVTLKVVQSAPKKQNIITADSAHTTTTVTSGKDTNKSEMFVCTGVIC